MKIIKIVKRADAVLKDVLHRWRAARRDWDVDEMLALIPLLKQEGDSRLVRELVRELELYRTNLRTIGKEKEILSNGDFVSERIKECKELIEKLG